MSLLRKYYRIGISQRVSKSVIVSCSIAKNDAAIDFSVIGEYELARNYTSRGGNAEITSEERAKQDQRELTKLMVVYSSNVDIPSSPREPSDIFSGEHSTEESFGSPIEKTKVGFKSRRNLGKIYLQSPGTGDSILSPNQYSAIVC